MDKKITIQTKTTAADYKTLIFFNMFLKKKATFYATIVVAILSLAAIIGRLAGIIPMADWYFYVCIAFWGLLLLQYILFEYVVRRFLASDKLVINSDRTTVIDDAGIIENDQEKSIVVYEWDKFYLAYETKKYFFLYINIAMALILPKRDFQTEEIPMLEKLIQEKLGKKFHKR